MVPIHNLTRAKHVNSWSSALGLVGIEGSDQRLQRHVDTLKVPMPASFASKVQGLSMNPYRQNLKN
jgi:hypothetical protein